MEIRRLEGILLEQGILSRNVEEAYRTARNIEIKIITRIPEVLETLLNRERIKAFVVKNSGEFILLRLEEGSELLVKNNLSINIEENSFVSLIPVNRNPLILKVENVEKFKEASLRLLNLLKNLKEIPLNYLTSFEKFINSGIFYENKVLKYILGNKNVKLEEDMKYKALKDGKKEEVNFINLLQLFSLENKKIFLPFRVNEEVRGKLLISLKSYYRILIFLNFKAGKLLIDIEGPRNLKYIKLKISSDSKGILEKLKNLKDELKLNLPLKSVEFIHEEKEEEKFLKELFEGEIINLKV